MSDFDWDDGIETAVAANYIPKDHQNISTDEYFSNQHPRKSSGRRLIHNQKVNRTFNVQSMRESINEIDDKKYKGKINDLQRDQPQNYNSTLMEPQSCLIDWKNLMESAKEDEMKRFAHLPPVVKVTYEECAEVKGFTKSQVNNIRLARNKITISTMDGTEPSDVPNPVTKFDHVLQPFPELHKIIKATGFQFPSPIQCQLWPLLMSGYDMIGIAQTGTGKTLAYLLPGLLHIDVQPYFRDRNRNGAPLCLIIAPTRELAQQIFEEASKFKYKGMRSVCVYGQGSYGQQCKSLRSGAEIVVATPGRLIDFVNKEIIDLNGISYFVLDEADRMLDMGFQPDILKISGCIRSDRQTVLTSATWPPDVEYIAKRLMKNPLKVQVGEIDLAAVSTVTQNVWVCEEEDKIERLIEFLRNLNPNDKVIIFANRKAMVDNLSVTLLLEHEIDSRVMHGGIEQSERESALRDLKSGLCKILIATDVASRGLDVSDLTYVINFDLPKSLEEYVHRSGRTGRAGKTGEVISFVTWENRNQTQELIDILQRSNQKVPHELMRLSERAQRFQQSRSSFSGSRGREGSGTGARRQGRGGFRRGNRYRSYDGFD